MSAYNCGKLIQAGCWGILVAVAFVLNANAADTGYFLFGKYRYFGPKKGSAYVADGIEDNETSGSRFYNTLARHQINYFKNTGRTFKEAMNYGGWKKDVRVMSGFEYDFRQAKTSTSSYGYNDKSGSYFLLSDKAVAGTFWRLGGGVSLSRYDSSYDNGLRENQRNYMGALYAIYNEPANQVRLRSRLLFGYGQSDIKRIAEINGRQELFRGSFNNWYYGFENSLSKTFGQGLFIQPLIEFNGWGIRQDNISEKGLPGYMLQTESRSRFMMDGLAGIYAGVRGKDAFGNHYNLKAGPDFTYILSDPYDAFELTEPEGKRIHMKKRPDYKKYTAWKAYLNYNLDNGLGFYSDFRYYVKDKDSVSFAIGLNYHF